MAGVWHFTARYSAVSGGECLGTFLQRKVNTTDVGTLTISQVDAAVTIASFLDNVGTRCTYTGTVSATSLRATSQSCLTADVYDWQCGTGVFRDQRFHESALNLQIAGPSLTGSLMNTYDVLVSPRGAVVGSMGISADVTAAQ